MPIRPFGKNRMVVAAVLGMVLGWGGLAGVAHAALITFNFEGNVTSTGGIVSSDFSTSDKLVGSFSFDSNTPDRNPSQGGGYLLTQLSYTLGHNSYFAIGDSASPRIEITSNSSTNPNTITNDLYRVFSVNNSGPSAGAQLPREFAIDISGQGKFPNDSLPLTPPSLGNVLSTNRRFAMSFVQPVGAVGAVSGELTSLTLAPVPIPGAVLLFGSGLIGLAALGKIRRARQS